MVCEGDAITVMLAPQAINECREAAARRHGFNVEEARRTQTWNGLSPGETHFVGMIGEAAFLQWLRDQGIAFSHDGFTTLKSYAEMREDFIINGRTVGVTTQKVRQRSPFAYRNWLYPLRVPGEARVLGPPQIWVHAAFDGGARVMLLGFADRATIIDAPLWERSASVPSPCHAVPRDAMRPLKEFRAVIGA